ncbi:nuclease-like protein [Prosthecobacter fusiformis]|uniref:Nuclease-like protein n=1 Tax=Prosthecobacter fusiformis TaxID=48464 RepID=A0A4R7STN4_9BACT|nr:thermonuclease family protein [Prosthecobacter fusiformis]TDU81657.1 nuclease-like protein [Prosthecobacter fusiformis]
MSRRRRRRPRSFPFSWLGLILLLALGAQGWREVQKIQNPPEPRSGPATKVFEVMYGARLKDDRNNDGDSFRILHDGKEHVLRLYFADSPEKQRDSYNEERLHEQGQYFGGLSEPRTVAVGQQAHAFAYDWLTNRPFTVYTKWQGVFGSGRHYAFVVFPDGEDLSAKLVREGLARIHTTGTTLPDGRSAARYELELKLLEEEARAARRGGWAQ